ncbi:23S rRNA (uracil(1939)-C(5))-methyltransferase RlmD [Desulfonatronum thioautotrophicum]|uniref:23S rRNA (uracil(1939)-C(5))-methyltransferase RlmD n=1 Tax=Desulfonatronum thioautotrophicum TaxID=617001 RepID=UPI0005EB69A1|nr:23S rRNA (uracil(1939)-C(5))-methyltransferase RlmD [Desulfonatronum thioautotrophicum]
MPVRDAGIQAGGDVQIGQELCLDVVKPVLGGDGLARHGGMAVFVPGALPGQRILARVSSVKARHARADLLEVLEQSAEYVQPSCPHFGSCGGCDWLHMDYARQLHWKRELVRESLRHLAAADIQVAPTIGSPRIHNYRNKMEFAAASRVAAGTGDTTHGLTANTSSVALGLRPRRLANAVVPIRSCALCPQVMIDVMVLVEQWAGKTGLPAYDPDTGRGFWRHLVVRQGADPGHVMLAVITSQDFRGQDSRDQDVGPSLAEYVANKLAGHSVTSLSVVHETRTDRALLAQGQRTVSVTGPKNLLHELGNQQLAISSRSFFQVNSGSAQKLLHVVADFAGLSEGETVWDLYCGVGAMALNLADKAGRVVGFETESQAVRDAQANARRNGITNCRFEAGDVSRTIPRILDGPSSQRPDVIVVDPPRAGMRADVVDQLLKIGAKKLILISCDPATLARDIKRLAASYGPCRVQPVDMFPHTSHIECVAELCPS